MQTHRHTVHTYIHHTHMHAHTGIHHTHNRNRLKSHQSLNNLHPKVQSVSLCFNREWDRERLKNLVCFIHFFLKLLVSLPQMMASPQLTLSKHDMSKVQVIQGVCSSFWKVGSKILGWTLKICQVFVGRWAYPNNGSSVQNCQHYFHSPNNLFPKKRPACLINVNPSECWR